MRRAFDIEKDLRAFLEKREANLCSYEGLVTVDIALQMVYAKLHMILGDDVLLWYYCNACALPHEGIRCPQCGSEKVGV